MEIFLKNMKFSGQFFRLTSLAGTVHVAEIEMNCTVWLVQILEK